MAIPLPFLGACKGHATQLRFVGLLARLPALMLPYVVGRQIMVQMLAGGYVLPVQLKPLQSWEVCGICKVSQRLLSSLKITFCWLGRCTGRR